MGGKTFAGFLAESAALANAFDLCVELAVLGIDLCIAGLFRRLRRLAVPGTTSSGDFGVTLSNIASTPSTKARASSRLPS